MIKAKNLSYSIPYGDTILENLSFELHPGEFLGVLGHNGSGKTTLMDLMNGFRGITSGELKVMGEDPHLVHRQHKQDIVFLSQDVSIKGNITIMDFLRFHSTFYPGHSMEDEKHLLKIFQLDSAAKVGSLSVGQQKKVQIIAGLSVRPKLLLIDEITAVLDPETRELFFKELQGAREKYGCAIVLATNIAEDLIDRADRVLFISGKSGNMHSPSEILKLFHLEAA